MAPASARLPQLKIESLHAIRVRPVSDAKRARDRVRNAANPPVTAGEIPYHHWRARWRAWRRATRPGPRFDLSANLSDSIADGSADLLRAWAADLPGRQRRWLAGRPTWH